MKTLHLRLLGGFQVRDAAGNTIEIPGHKPALLLAYLALRAGERQTREKLTTLLWSDRAENQARASLRQAIWALRRALGDHGARLLVVEHESLSLNPHAIESDVATLEQLVAKGATTDLCSAVELYRGPLLEGVRISDRAFQELVREEDQRIYDLVIDAYTRLLADRSSSHCGDEIKAKAAKRLLALEPLQEVAHQELIRHYARKGQVGLALRQYQSCVDVLRKELHTDPGAETQALIAEVKGAPFEKEEKPEDQARGPVDIRRQEEQETSLQEKPSIAVLPFRNLSGDPEQEYVSDGITEDITTALSRLRWFLVIAQHSSFVYKERTVDIKQIGRELGVQYILEGSVRKSGNRLRITAELVDAVTGTHHWAEHYDRELADIFELQDEITQKVTATIEPKLLAVEGTRAQSRSPEDLGAWELVARAMSHYGRMTTEESETAIEILQQAVAKYPNYGPAHSLLAFAFLVSGHVGWIPESHDYHYAAELAHRAARLDDEDPWAHLALGYLAFTDRQTDEAVRQFLRALDLNPNFATAYGYLGWALVFDGQSEKAIRYFRRALRMSPHDPLKAFFYSGTCVAHYFAHRYDEAIEWGRKAIRERPGFTAAQRILCASLAQAGREEETRQAMKRLREIQPNVSMTWIKQYVPYTPRVMPHFLDGMRKAGLD